MTARLPARATARLPHAGAGVVWLCIALVVSGCISPARTNEQYRAKARIAVQQAAGEVATAAKAVDLQLQRRTFSAYTDEVVTSSETALGGVDDSFGSVQPPDPSSDGIRDAVSSLLSDAQAAAAHARIAVRRGDTAGMRAALDELGTVAEDLSDAEEQLR